MFLSQTLFANDGGGGSSGAATSTIKWVEAANSPIPSTANNIEIYSYSAALSQSLYGLIKVPSNYIIGSPISLLFDFYSNDTSGTVLIKTLATLIRPGTDLISSTTNQRTSTNAAVTQSGGTQNKPQNVTADLSSTTGTINSVAVSPSDYILIQLSRGTDSATGDAQVPVWGCQVIYE